MDVRIFRWPRFVELFEDFREMFADHLNRVKNKSSLDHFEYKNDVKEWEWRVIFSMCGGPSGSSGPSRRLPSPFSPESLSVYILMFVDHDEMPELLKIRDGRTPLHELNQWTPNECWWLGGREIQEMNSAFESRHLELKRSVRAWLKRWNVRYVPWTSRNRSAVCKVMSIMIQSHTLRLGPHIQMAPTLTVVGTVEDWIDSHIPTTVKEDGG